MWLSYATALQAPSPIEPRVVDKQVGAVAYLGFCEGGGAEPKTRGVEGVSPPH